MQLLHFRLMFLLRKRTLFVTNAVFAEKLCQISEKFIFPQPIGGPFVTWYKVSVGWFQAFDQSLSYLGKIPQKYFNWPANFFHWDITLYNCDIYNIYTIYFLVTVEFCNTVHVNFVLPTKKTELRHFSKKSTQQNCFFLLVVSNKTFYPNLGLFSS